jgi:hypothetical protein
MNEAPIGIFFRRCTKGLLISAEAVIHILEIQEKKGWAIHNSVKSRYIYRLAVIAKYGAQRYGGRK